MKRRWLLGSMCVAAAVISFTGGAGRAQDAPSAETPPNPLAARDAQGGNGADLGPGLFATADADVDGAVTRAELKALLGKWAAEAGSASDAGATDADLTRVIRLLQPRRP